MSFDPENRRHAEAMQILYAEPERQRTELIVECILRWKHADQLEQTVRRIVQEEMENRHISSARMISQAPQPLPKDENPLLSDIPDSLLHAMDDLENPSEVL